MRKIVYSVAMSRDGYLAGPNGEADWIHRKRLAVGRQILFRLRPLP
jgi:hypothetical protein